MHLQTPYLHSKRFDVVGTVGPASKVLQIKLDLIPSFFQSQWQRTDKRLNTSSRLKITCSKTSPYILIV